MQRYRAVPAQGTDIEFAGKEVCAAGGTSLLILPKAATFTFEADDAALAVIRKLSCINAVTESKDIDIPPEGNGRYCGLGRGA